LHARKVTYLKGGNFVMYKWFLPILAGSWLTVSPLIWSQSRTAGLIAAGGGALIMILSAGAIVFEALEPWAGLVAATVATTGLISAAPRLEAGNRMVAGLIALVGAIAPTVRVYGRGQVPPQH
jgi:hypothetical protein